MVTGTLPQHKITICKPSYCSLFLIIDAYLHDDPLCPERAPLVVAPSDHSALDRVLAEDVVAVRVGVAPPEAGHHRAPGVRQRVRRLQQEEHSL